MPLFGEAKKKYQREWVAARKAKWFKDKCCVVCGVRSNLELDHIDPKKKVSHNIWSWSESRINTEVAKCQVLCKTHHKEKTKNNKEYGKCAVGEKVNTAKLTVQQVIEIRKKYATGKYTYTALAKEYGVTRWTCSNVVNRDWKSVK